MKKVGVTGGIGSGKSTVCQIFKVLNIPVYDADAAAKRLMQEDPRLKMELKKAFGESTFDKEGRLDRKALADKVFRDKEQLERLNSLVHPAVFEDVKRWSVENATAPYLVKEAALLFESGSYREQDILITVFAPEEIAIQRVMQRDNVSEAAVRERMAHQWPQEKKAALSDYIIHNTGNELLVPQVWELHRKLLGSKDTLQP